MNKINIDSTELVFVPNTANTLSVYIDQCPLLNINTKCNDNNLSLLCTVIKRLVTKNNAESIKIYSSEDENKDLFSNLLKYIRKNLPDIKIKYIELKKDDLPQDNLPPVTDPRCYMSNLQNYKNRFIKISTILNNIDKFSNCLLNTKLYNNVWGIKNIIKLIANLKAESGEIDINKDNALKIINDLKTKIYIILYNYNKNNNMENLIYLTRQLNHDIELLRNLIIKIIFKLYPIYSLEDIFKNNTSYPLSWFFNCDDYINFCIYYNLLIDELFELIDIVKNIRNYKGVLQNG